MSGRSYAYPLQVNDRPPYYNNGAPGLNGNEANDSEFSDEDEEGEEFSDRDDDDDSSDDDEDEGSKVGSIYDGTSSPSAS